MKNKFIALALVTLSIATTTVSCTKNDDLQPTKAQNVETTKVAFSVNAENANSATGRIVDQNVVPVYVNQVQIWAKSNVNPAFTVHEMFTFGAPGVGVATGFALDNVALGSNTFQAESWGNATDKRLSLGAVLLPNSGSNVLDVMKAHTPYIETSNQATQPTVTIVKGANPTVALTMATYNGRILAKFVQETPNADDYIATVSATVPNGTYDAPDGSDTYTTLPETTIASNTGFEWSNANARLTQSAVFTIKVYANNNGVKGALLNTITKEVAVASATTKLCTFTVHNTDVLTNIEQGGIKLTFPTIGEEVINQ
jgi:hypothetical protein